LLELADPPLRALEQLAQLGIVAVLGQELTGARGVIGGTPVLDRQLVGRLQPPVLAPDLGIALAVVDHRGIRHLTLQIGKSRLDLCSEVVDHATTSIPTRSSAPASRGFSTASTAPSAAIATASCERSGSRVVSFCSCMPGHISVRAQRFVRLRPNHLISSKDKPATIGMPRMRD